MWIAKPISQLSESEYFQWEQIRERPLSQTLAWAKAIDAVSGKAYLVFSPDEKVGGIVFELPKSLGLDHKKVQYECVNGPLLNWDSPDAAPRQLATFALATSKLSPHFQSLSIKPRWTENNFQNRLNLLPLEAAEHSSAATLVLQLKDSKEQQFEALSSRMQRTLTLSWKSSICTKWEKFSPSLLDQFFPAITVFGKTHGFSTPPLRWFQALTQEPKVRSSCTPSFWLTTSVKKEDGKIQSITQILISQLDNEAHYLFGHETRTEGLRSAISTSATAHWEAITRCATMGMKTYDFNGYIDESSPENPYFGVCEFKKQFLGKIIRYQIPEFRIQ
jgi:hypothetical protein